MDIFILVFDPSIGLLLLLKYDAELDLVQSLLITYIGKSDWSGSLQRQPIYQQNKSKSKRQ